MALSQIQEAGQIKSGAAWIVPRRLHAPIIQDAVLLKRGLDNPAAVEWLRLLRSDKVKTLIRGYGYAIR